MYHISGLTEKKSQDRLNRWKKKPSKNPRGLHPKSSEEFKLEGTHLNIIKLNQKYITEILQWTSV